jgi:hypothetical protein
MRWSGRAVVAAVVLVMGAGTPAYGLDLESAKQAAPPTTYGVIAGRAVAASSGEAVSLAQVRLLELRRVQTADAAVGSDSATSRLAPTRW